MKEKCKLCWKSNENDTNVFFWFKYQSGLALEQFIWKIWAKFKNSIDPCHHRTWLIWIKLLQAWSTANTQNIFRWKSQLIYNNFTLSNLWTLGFPKVIFVFLRSVSAQFYSLHVELRQVVTVLLSRTMNFSSTSLSPVSSAFFHFLVFSILVLLKQKKADFRFKSGSLVFCFEVLASMHCVFLKLSAAKLFLKNLHFR